MNEEIMNEETLFIQSYRTMTEYATNYHDMLQLVLRYTAHECENTAKTQETVFQEYAADINLSSFWDDYQEARNKCIVHAQNISSGYPDIHLHLIGIVDDSTRGHEVDTLIASLAERLSPSITLPKHSS